MIQTCPKIISLQSELFRIFFAIICKSFNVPPTTNKLTQRQTVKSPFRTSYHVHSRFHLQPPVLPRNNHIARLQIETNGSYNIGLGLREAGQTWPFFRHTKGGRMRRRRRRRITKVKRSLAKMRFHLLLLRRLSSRYTCQCL